MHKLDTIKKKIFKDAGQLKSWLAYWRFKDEKIVFTNGCFDILHMGHVDYLARAASHGNVLIIGLNTDDSVKRIKGADRPVQDEDSRGLVMAALHFVDAVVYFDEDTPYNLIKMVEPDILVKGSDYKAEEIIGYDIVTENGGEVVTVDYVKGYSTSNIIEKIKTEKAKR